MNDMTAVGKELNQLRWRDSMLSIIGRLLDDGKEFNYFDVWEIIRDMMTDITMLTSSVLAEVYTHTNSGTTTAGLADLMKYEYFPITSTVPARSCRFIFPADSEKRPIFNPV